MELKNKCKRCNKFYFNVALPCTCKERAEDLEKLAQETDLMVRIERKKDSTGTYLPKPS